ncbi:MAG TPA: hypothetical protein VNS61_11595 [Caldimonas sp.]|nr:hypothetical protein [Caldimonas sp.]
MSEFVEYSLLGILSGVTALVALSFVLIYKGTGVVNFAVGEVMMLGAYIYYAGTVSFGLAPWLAFALAVVVERLVLRPLSGQAAVAVLMATIGMASIIHGGVEAAWGREDSGRGGVAQARPMNNSFPRLIDGMCATLRSEMLTRLDDEFARGQVYGVINLLNTFKVRADWSAAFLQQQIEAQRSALQGAAEVARGAKACGGGALAAPPSAKSATFAVTPIGDLLAARDAGNAAIGAWLA